MRDSRPAVLVALVAILNVILAGPVSQLACALDAPTGPVSQYSAFQGGARRAGWMNGIAPLRNDTLWEFDSCSSMQSSPVFGAGMVFIGTDNGFLLALDQSSGRPVWNRSFGEFAMVQSTPWFEQGVLYVGSQNGSNSALWALNASNGNLLWCVPDDSGIAASPAYYGGVVYSCSLNGTVMAVNASDGSVIWQKKYGGELWTSPAIWNGTVYGGSVRGVIFALSASDGSERWNITCPSPWMVYASACIANGTVFIGTANYASHDGELLALDASTGAQRWNFTECESVYGTASYADGVVYAHVWNKTAGGGFLVAAPENDPDGNGRLEWSELLWSFQTGDWEGGSSPLVLDNAVAVGSTKDMMFLVDRKTGRELWNVTLGEKVVSSPAFSDGRIFVSCMDGKLSAIGSPEGLPGLNVTLLLEKDRLPAGQVMRISVGVSDEFGGPVEGAYVKMSVSWGNLSQGGASTFPDGTNSFKYLALATKANRTITVRAEVARGGYRAASNTTAFTVTVYESAYTGVRSQSTFNLSKYIPYIVIIIILAALCVSVGVLMVRGWKQSPPGK